MTLREYILNRIKSIQSSGPHSEWRFEDKERMGARVNELYNLLDVMDGPALEEEAKP